MKDKKNLESRLENIETLLKSQVLNNKTAFDIDELALYTGFSKQYLYKLTSQNKIKYYSPNGKKIFFNKEEVDRWLFRNAQLTNDEIEQEAINHSVFKNKTR